MASPFGSDAGPALRRALLGLSAGDVAAVVATGLDRQSRLAVLADAPDDIEHFAGMIGKGDAQHWVGMLTVLANAAGEDDARARRREARVPWARLAMASAARDKERRVKAFIEFAAPPSGTAGTIVHATPPRPAAPAWPRSGRTKSGTTPAGEETAARNAILGQLRKEILLLDLPVAPWLRNAGESRAAYLGQGLRLATLGCRLRAWRHFSRWLRDAVGARFPRGVDDTLRYLETRAAEPCGRTCLRSAIAGLRFVEIAGQVEPERHLHIHPLVRGAVDELTASLPASTAAAANLRGQAPRYPLSVLLALERAVMDEGRREFERYWAWLLLLRVWGSLRYDDLRWTDPQTLALSDRGLVGTLGRTKTSGQGKKVKSLAFYVSAGAWLTQSGWLGAGWRLWLRLRGGAPFFVNAPCRDRRAFSGKPAGYREASACTSALLASLTRAAGESEPGKRLIIDAGVSFWTEHSPRNFLASAAAALEVPREDWRRVGRWAADASDHYVRTTRVIVERIQSKAAVSIREALAGNHDIMDDAEMTDKLVLHAVRRGIDEPTAKDFATSLLACPGGPRVVTTTVAASTPVPVRSASASSTSSTGSMASRSRPSSSRPGGAGPDPATGYVISVTGSAGYRRLHFIGRCHRLPGVHYKVYELFGDTVPGNALYTSVCKACWPDGAVTGDPDDQPASTGSSSSSTSSSRE